MTASPEFDVIYIVWRSPAVNPMFIAAPVAFRANGSADGVL
jgi:hypothetical protein